MNVFLKFKFNWVSCVSSDNSASEKQSVQNLSSWESTSLAQDSLLQVRNLLPCFCPLWPERARSWVRKKSKIKHARKKRKSANCSLPLIPKVAHLSWERRATKKNFDYLSVMDPLITNLRIFNFWRRKVIALLAFLLRARRRQGPVKHFKGP